MESHLSSRLSALSHPQRMSVFRLLIRRCPDSLPAGEIAQILNFKPSTTSVYLSTLTKAGLILQTRQGTSLRYEVCVDAARAFVADLFLDCCKGRPDLCPPEMSSTFEKKITQSDQKFNVLFVCTGNTARSIMAEAILRHVAPNKFNTFSAGLHPRSKPHPFAIETLSAHGLDTSRVHCKSVSEFQTEESPLFDFVFTVCDLAANEDYPVWKGRPISSHWGLPDPVEATGTTAEKRLAFQKTYSALAKRIEAFAGLPIAKLDGSSLQQKVDNISKSPEK